MKPERFFSAAVAMFLFVGLFVLNTAHAYPAGSDGSGVPTDTVTLGTSFETMVAPFLTFFQSLSGSIGSQPVLGGPIETPDPSSAGFNFSNIQNINFQQLLQELNQWFEHLNPSEVITALLNGILWVLWLTGQFIQWLLSLVH